MNENNDSNKVTFSFQGQASTLNIQYFQSHTDYKVKMSFPSVC